MKKLLILLAILVLLLLVGGSYVFLHKLKGITRPSPQPLSTVTIPERTVVSPSSATPDATMEFLNQTPILKVGDQSQVSVVLNTTADVYVVDLRVTYDAQALTLVTIKPGDFFAQPQEFKKTIDQNAGTILYSLGALTPANGKKALAVLTFQAKTGKNKGSIMVTDKTLVAKKGAQAATVSLPISTDIVIQK